MSNQLFIIGSDIWRGLDFEEVMATAYGLKQLDMYHLPYPSVDIEFTCEDYFSMLAKQDRATKEDIEKFVRAANDPLPAGVVFRLVNVTTTQGRAPTIHWYSYITKYRSDVKFSPDKLEKLRTTFCDILISLLAVKNIQKTHITDKLARLGIGKSKHRYAYTTTLSLPVEIADIDRHQPTGKTLCPHFRRGHIRNQAFGPHSQLRKSIWIEPAFIHADEDYVSHRTAYNVSKAAS